MENTQQNVGVRRCNTPVNCSKCGQLIVKGSPNFYYNPRGADKKISHYDCAKPNGWNYKSGLVETLEEMNVEASKPVVIIEKFGGNCKACGKPKIATVTPVQRCRDGKTYIHTYCVDTTVEETQASERSENVEEQHSVEESKSQMNVSQKTPTNPLIAMIWEEIKPLVATVETDSKRVSETLEAIEEMMSELERKISSRPTELLKIENVAHASSVEIDSPHPSLKLLIFTAGVCKMHTYLYGPAGSGKSTGAQQVAQAMKLDFYSISLNRQSTPTLLIGYNDLNGNYVQTDFYKAYKNGGVYLIDEMDNASGNLLTTLNSALANGHMSFPCGPVDKHADFVCIATGNTTGRGADRQYNDRQQLDAATIDRFKFIEWNYDEKSELIWALAKNSEATNWVKHVQAIRAKATTNAVRLAVTPRASIDGAYMLACAKQIGFNLDLPMLHQMAIYKGLDADTVKKIAVIGGSL